MNTSREKNTYRPISEELTHDELADIHGGECNGDAAFWLGIGLSMIPGARLVGYLISTSAKGCDKGMSLPSHNYAKSY